MVAGQTLRTRLAHTNLVVARIEDADYEGHSLKRLHRIADALGRQVEIKFVGHTPSPPKAGSTSKSRKRTANR
jgi:hypothetical protein